MTKEERAEGMRQSAVALGRMSAATLRRMLESFEPAERKQIFDELTDGYCTACGRDLPCHCQNDE